MSLYTLFFKGRTFVEAYQDYSKGSTAYKLSSVITDIKEKQSYVRDLSVDALIEFLDAVAQSWLNRASPIQQMLSRDGLNFLIYWFRQNHTRQLIEASLRAPASVLDDFCDNHYTGHALIARPRGLVAHWLAGNVPLLGMLSLVQGILTKNANVLKASSQNAWMLPLLLDSMKEINTDSVQGNLLVQSIAVVYFDREEKALQSLLSENSQVRIAWGGRNSVEAVMNLPKHYGTEDIIFGPKTSFMAIGKECLGSQDNASKIAKRAVQDIVAFDQQGCNAPHTVFIEKGACVDGYLFSQLLAKELQVFCKENPTADISPEDVFNIESHRVEYAMRGAVFHGQDLKWTVVFSADDTGLAEPCFNRTVFVREIKALEDLSAYCSHHTQSVGVAVAHERKAGLAKQLMSHGIDRMPDVGTMSLYEMPWDGMFVMDRLVRWCQLNHVYDFTTTPSR